MSGREKRRDSADSWKDNLAEVTVRRGRTVYRPSKNSDLPALLQSQVIASRDPRLSPSLPNTSIYSRDFDLEDDSYEFDESGSFNSEDWYMDDVSDDFEEQAKKVKVKVHVNPKFLDRERFQEDKVELEKKEEGEDGGGKSKEKVKSWLKESDHNSDHGTPSRQGKIADSRELSRSRESLEPQQKTREANREPAIPVTKKRDIPLQEDKRERDSSRRRDFEKPEFYHRSSEPEYEELDIQQKSRKQEYAYQKRKSKEIDYEERTRSKEQEYEEQKREYEEQKRAKRDKYYDEEKERLRESGSFDSGEKKARQSQDYGRSQESKLIEQPKSRWETEVENSDYESCSPEKARKELPYRGRREHIQDIKEPDREEFDRREYSRKAPSIRSMRESDLDEAKEPERRDTFKGRVMEKDHVRDAEFEKLPSAFQRKEIGYRQSKDSVKKIKETKRDSPYSESSIKLNRDDEQLSSRMSVSSSRDLTLRKKDLDIEELSCRSRREDKSPVFKHRGIESKESRYIKEKEDYEEKRFETEKPLRERAELKELRYKNKSEFVKDDMYRKEAREKKRAELPEGPASPTKALDIPLKKHSRDYQEASFRRETAYSPDTRIKSDLSPVRLPLQKSIPMFPDEEPEQVRRPPSPMIRGSLFRHIKPLQTKSFGQQKETSDYSQRKTKRLDEEKTLVETSPFEHREKRVESGEEKLRKQASKKESRNVSTLQDNEVWHNKPLQSSSFSCLRPLSGYANRSIDANNTQGKELIDRLVSRHKRDVCMELDRVCTGQQNSKYDKPWKHLSSLSLETQLESTFSESAMVKRVYLAVLKEWMTSKPLDGLLLNPKGTEGQRKPENIRSSLKTDAIVENSLKDYIAQTYHLLKGDQQSVFVKGNVFPKPASVVEETVDEVYRQVHQYMDFLSKKGMTGSLSEKSRGDMSLVKPNLQGVPEPVQPPQQSSVHRSKRKADLQVPDVPVGLAYSPSRPTGQDEEDENYYDPTMSPKKPKFEEKRKEKKKEKKEKKHKKKDKTKKAKKKRKDRRGFAEDGDEDHQNRSEMKFTESESSGSESPQSTRRYSENIESPKRDERYSEEREIEEPPSRWADDKFDRRERRGSDRKEYERRDKDYDIDRHDYGRGYSRRGNRHHSDAFLARKNERERKAKAREVMRVCYDRLLSLKPQDEPVQETTIATWKYVHEIMHQEYSYVQKQLVEASKHLTHDFDAEKGFMWALVLAVHSQVMQDAQDRIALEEATAAAAKVEQELEEGELEASPVHEPLKDDKSKEDIEKESEKAKKPGKGSHGNKLLTAFRQQMAAKKREELGIVQKVEISKLSPALAAKKPKPSSSRPLFKPPAAFEMLKAAQEERERQRRRRTMHKDASSADDGQLKFDGIVREGLVSDALKSFFNLTDDVLQPHYPQIADDFMNYVMPMAMETVNVVKQHMGLAATIVIVVKERREKEKQKESALKDQQDDNTEEDYQTTDDERSPSHRDEDEMVVEDNHSKVRKEPSVDKDRESSQIESCTTKDDTTVVDMDMDEEVEGDIEVNEYGTAVNEYGSIIEKNEEMPKLKQPIKLTSTSKFIKQKESLQGAFGGDDADEKRMKRKLEVLSDDEEKDTKKIKDERKGAIAGEISKEKMICDDKIDFDYDAGEVSKKLERMQKGGSSSNKHVAAERIQAIISEGPTEEEVDASENGQLVLKKFTPVSSAPEEMSSAADVSKNTPPMEKAPEKTIDKEKKTVVESVISVKGNPVATTAAPLPKAKSPAAKSFKSKGWGPAPKASCTSTQKVSAQDILARLQEKAASSTKSVTPTPPLPPEEKKPEDVKGDEPAAAEDDLYQTALTSTDDTDWGEVNSPQSQLKDDNLPPLPDDEAPPLPPEPEPTAPPPTEPPPPQTSKSSGINAGVVAKAAPQISKPPVTFPALPDISQPPPPLLSAAEPKTFPGNYQQYPPPPPSSNDGLNQQTQQPPPQSYGGTGWGDFQNYNNHHWDGYQWVQGPPPWGQGWPPPTWQPPPNSSGADWNWSSGNPPMQSWPNWQQQHHPPPPPHGSWGQWPQGNNSGSGSNESRSSVVNPTNKVPDYSDLPPGEEPPVPQVWPFKQPKPPGIESSLSTEKAERDTQSGEATIATNQFISVPSKKKPEWKKPPFPYKPVLPHPERVRMYVFNREKLMCKSIDAFLTEMEQDKFDPYNLACLSYLPDMDVAVVLIHQDDKEKLHVIPNLAKLKQHPKVKFATYFDANDVAVQKFTLILPSGGMLIADDTVLLGLQPAALKEVCRFMVNASKNKDKGSWSLLVHDHVMTKLNMRKLDLTNTSQEVLRMSNLMDTIAEYRTEGIIEVLYNHECNAAERPAHEYVHCCVKLQAEKAEKHRHVFLLSDVKMTSEKSAQFLDSGIGIISVPDFLQTYAGKSITAPMVAVSRPSYGKRSLAMYDDCPLTNASHELEVEKVPAETYSSLHAIRMKIEKPAKTPLLPSPSQPPLLPNPTSQQQQSPLLPSPTQPKLGEVVRPDANVRPSEGRYDGAAAGPGRGGWTAGGGDVPPGI